MPVTDADDVSGLLGALYQGPLEAQPWAGFAERLRQAFNARNVAITLNHPEGPVLDTYVMAAEPDDTTDWPAVERVYRAHFMERDPHRLDLLAPGEICVVEAGSGSSELAAMMTELDVGQSLRTGVAEPGGMRCWIDVVRRRCGASPFDVHDEARLRELLPHLARALEIHARAMSLELERSVHEDTIDFFLLGSVLLDGGLRVLRINRAASTIMAAHPGIGIGNGRLMLQDPRARRALEDALSRALSGSSADAPSRAGDLLRVEDRGGAVGLLVKRVAQGPWYQGPHAPSVVVYLSDLSVSLEALHPAREIPQELLARLFGLTPQEARLALLLADGCSLAQAAGRIGVAETAARSYSKRIYAKTGIKGQSDLVRLVYRSLALLR